MIDFNSAKLDLILVSDFLFVLHDERDRTIWPTCSYTEERFATRNQSLIIEGFADKVKRRMTIMRIMNFNELKKRSK